MPGRLEGGLVFLEGGVELSRLGGDGGLQSCGLSTMLAKSVTRRIEGV